MASVLKREGPRGRQYLVRYRDPSGKVRSKSFRNRKAADDYARSVEVDKTRGSWVDPNAGKVTLVAYSEQWLSDRPALRPRTQELYRYMLDRLILPTLGEVELAKITSGAVRSWHADLLRAGKPGPSTVAKAYRLLRAMLTTATDDDLIVKNPCSIKGAGVEKSDERPTATPEQVWALADAIESRYRAMVLSAAFLGLRWGELLGLSRRHVNLLHRTVTIDRQLGETGGKLSFGPPKSEAGVRTIAIPGPLVAELEHHLSTYAAPDPDALLFVGARGASPTRGNWSPKWRAVCATVDGLAEGFHFHDLRHTSNTLAAATGASTRELMHRMGHASPAAALRYQHATPERDKAIADALGEALRRDGTG